MNKKLIFLLKNVFSRYGKQLVDFQSVFVRELVSECVCVCVRPAVCVCQCVWVRVKESELLEIRIVSGLCLVSRRRNRYTHSHTSHTHPHIYTYTNCTSQNDSMRCLVISREANKRDPSSSVFYPEISPLYLEKRLHLLHLTLSLSRSKKQRNKRLLCPMFFAVMSFLNAPQIQTIFLLDSFSFPPKKQTKSIIITWTNFNNINSFFHSISP